VRQWRLAAIVLTAVAAVELILLIAVGGALLSRSDGAATVGAKRPPAKAEKAKPATKASATAAALPRRKTGVLVLNGNGRTGAASVAANRVTQRGYRVRGVANAPNAGYARSIVMYRPGFKSEGARLARDLGVPIVGPLDGMRPSQLNGAHAVLILGA
jgi:LytR cell envelope-related transcriptional attenuator